MDSPSTINLSCPGGCGPQSQPKSCTLTSSSLMARVAALEPGLLANMVDVMPIEGSSKAIGASSRWFARSIQGTRSSDAEQTLVEYGLTDEPSHDAQHQLIR